MSTLFDCSTLIEISRLQNGPAQSAVALEANPHLGSDRAEQQDVVEDEAVRARRRVGVHPHPVVDRVPAEAEHAEENLS